MSNMREHIRDTIKLINDYLKRPEESITKEIIERITYYVNNIDAKEFLMRNLDIAQDLLDAIYQYIKFRHIILKEEIEKNLKNVFSPPSLSKLIFEASVNRKFLILKKPKIKGVTISAIISSINELKNKRKKKKTLNRKNVDRREISGYLLDLIRRKEILEMISDQILREMPQNGITTLKSVLKNDGRPVGYMEKNLRLIALISLAIHGHINLIKEKDNIFIKVNHG